MLGIEYDNRERTVYDHLHIAHLRRFITHFHFGHSGSFRPFFTNSQKSLLSDIGNMQSAQQRIGSHFRKISDIRFKGINHSQLLKESFLPSTFVSI